jgi:glycosyltransferase involved in cell wall biosynthesis
MKTVLIDLTALNTTRRLRGVGRHVRELAVGLSRLSAQDLQGLRLLGLTRLDMFGGAEVTPDFGEFEGLPEIREASRLDDERARWHRRTGLWRAASKVRADLVHVPDADVTPWILPLGRSRLVVTCHDLASLRPSRHDLLRGRGARALRRSIQARRFLHAHHVIAISSYTAEDLRQLFGLEPARVSVVYNGVDLSKWTDREQPECDASVLTKYGLRRRAYALYVGDAAWRKNRAGMLRGLRRARELRPDLGLQLAWAGRLTVSEAGIVDREARTLGIRHAVHLLNYVSDDVLGALYRGAAAHLFVSRHEGFGLTVVEAMACGCPVITTRRTALAEVAGNAAVHVEPEEHDAIGEALVRVTTDTALRNDLVERGVARALQFSSERQARETVRIFHRVLHS